MEDKITDKNKPKKGVACGLSTAPCYAFDPITLRKAALVLHEKYGNYCKVAIIELLDLANEKDGKGGKLDEHY